MSYILGAILLYLLYRFVVVFVLPVTRASYRIKQQFDKVKQHMQEQANAASGTGNGTVAGEKKAEFDMEGEYIPFDEVKE